VASDSWGARLPKTATRDMQPPVRARCEQARQIPLEKKTKKKQFPKWGQGKKKNDDKGVDWNLPTG